VRRRHLDRECEGKLGVPAPADDHSRYSVTEEIVHALTHGVGALLSLVGLAMLVAIAVRAGGLDRILAAGVFGLTLVTMFGVSTAYHAVPARRLKRWLRVMDHSAVYLLIAGTYTPFSVISLRGPWGWSLLAVIWSLALAGIMLKLRPVARVPGLSVVLYVAMGWLGVVAARPLFESVPPGGLVLLLLGGVTYTTGVLFFVWRRLPFNHAIWHLFVLAGSAFHFLAVLIYVLPRFS
jgi:hemolysin III